MRCCAGAFSDKTQLVLEKADIANYDGQIRVFEVETKAARLDDFGEVETPAVIKTVHIGIGKCVVTEDGEPMKVNAMLKMHMLAELQVRS